MKHIYLFFLMLITFNFGYGQIDQIIVAIDRGNVSVDQSSTAGFADHISAKGFTRGSGLGYAGGGPTSGAPFTASNWAPNGDQTNAKSENDYIEWSVTADPNFKVNISELQITANTSAGGPRKWQIFYSVNEFVTETPLSPLPLDLPPLADGQYAPITFNASNLEITSSFGGTVKFRLYAWAGNGLNTNTLKIQTTLFSDDFEVYNPGCIIKGNLEYDGLLYSNEQWIPAQPSAQTGNENAFIADGIYEIGTNEFGVDINENITLNNLVIGNGATVAISSLGNLTVNENLSVGGNPDTPGNLILNSTSTQYSSLIVTGIATGNVTYNRHVNINTAGNDLISAPVTGQGFDQFILNNNNIRNNDGTLFLFGPFEKSGGTYVNWTNAITTGLSAGTGYRAASTDNGTFTFVGDVNIGTVDQQLINGGSAYKEWNLIGNPYPSYIKLSDFLNASNNAQFESNTAGVYGYDGVASDGWEVWNSAYSDMNPDALIAPGQGFLVSSKIGNGTISFTPTMRSTGTSDDFIPLRSSSSNKAYAKVKITNGKKSYTTDLYFNEHSTKALDPGYDAAVFGKKAPDFSIYSHLIENNSGLDMAVQSLHYTDLSNDVAIPLGVNVTAGQQITVSLGKTILPEGTEIYLEDNVNNTFTLLNSADYTFTTKTNVKDTGRFFLRFSNRTLSTSNPNDVHGLHVYTTDSKVLFIKGLLNERTMVSVYDIQGRLVNTAQLKTNTKANQLDLSPLNTGVYIVKLKNTSQDITQKIMLH